MKQIFYLILIVFTGCIKETSTNYYAYLNNKTTHKIEITPYRLGSVVTSKILVLNANVNKEITNGAGRGLNGNVGFTSANFAGMDSVKVIFDNTYVITHYFNTSFSFFSKFYLYDSLRNLDNYKSYFFTSNDLSKVKRENKYVYIFTEQDYLDAK